MILDTTMDIYELLDECLKEIYPTVTVTLISSDPTLVQLGFAEKVPCQIDIKATVDQIREIMDIAVEYEIDAYNGPGGREALPNSPEWQKYVRYGWLSDFLYAYISNGGESY